MPYRRAATVCVALAALVSAVEPARELRKGVWTSADLDGVPIPARGYQVYLLGEMHGFSENAAAGAAYLKKLYEKSGLRDVAVEEDAVYQSEAEAYVDGRSDTLPAGLCLRAESLEMLRSFNRGRRVADRVRVHLVDIDSPAPTIRAHLMSVGERARVNVAIPDEAAIRNEGLASVEALRRMVPASFYGELRTIEHSIGALRGGLEVGVGMVNGSPYMEDREAAIAANIGDLVRQAGSHGVLAMYGYDHASRRVRRDGGPGRNEEFAPLVLRLERAGTKVFSVIHFPLGGRWRWRGHSGGLFWAPGDAALEDAEPLDRVYAEAGPAKYLYIDARRNRVHVPSQDVMGYGADAFLMLREGVAMADRCGVR